MSCLSASRCVGLKGRSRARALAATVLPATMIAALLPGPVDARPGPRTRERAEAAQAMAHARKPEGPLQIIVSLGSQRLWVYDRKGLLETSTVSTGVGGYPTPLGVFA
ncbi:MAG TPA: L,D-transpeptidase family protein, partial [Hyphomicrobiaceae bacterium]|nr:L,D-transpeptidase family protein [Hyphomicrobiaceae bacterium]